MEKSFKYKYKQKYLQQKRINQKGAAKILKHYMLFKMIYECLNIFILIPSI